MPTDAQTLQALFGGGSGVGGDIADFQKQIAANDTWRQAANPILAAKFNTSTWTPGQTIGVTAGQAFLGALLNAIGQRDEANQTAAVAQVLPQIYKDPMGASSMAAPEGVDQGAFNALKMSAMAKGYNTNEAIRQIFGQKGMILNPDGTATLPPGEADSLATLDNVAAKAKADNKAANATGSRAMVSVAQDLSARMAGVGALNDAKNEIANQFGARTFGKDSSIGGAIDYLGKFIPGTDAYQFQKDLPALADPLTQGLTGGKPTIASLHQTLGMLERGFGQPADSSITTMEKSGKVLDDKIIAGINALSAAGWPEIGNPVDANGQPLMNLTQIKEKYGLLSQGGGLDALGIGGTKTLPETFGG